MKKLIESLPAKQIEDFDAALLDEDLSDLNIHVVNNYASKGSFIGLPAFGFTRTYEETDNNGKTIRALPITKHPTLAHIDSLTTEDMISTSREQFKNLNKLFVENTALNQCLEFVKKMFRMQSKNEKNSNKINNSDLNEPDNNDNQALEK